MQRGASYGQKIQPMSNTFYHQSTSENNEYQYDDLRNDFARVTYFDKSAAFGMSDDKLGRLAEINKQQMEQALRDVDNFRRTDNTFNRSPFIQEAHKNNL
jgi:hypothetical protein